MSTYPYPSSCPIRCIFRSTAHPPHSIQHTKSCTGRSLHEPSHNGSWCATSDCCTVREQTELVISPLRTQQPSLDLVDCRFLVVFECKG